MFTVYVAAPYIDAPIVRELHGRLIALGAHPMSSWADNARGPENFAQFTEVELRDIAKANDYAIVNSDVVIVLARLGAGGETYAEARLALVMRKPVIWVGRRILSAYREGVARVEDIDEAIEHIAQMVSERRAG